MILLQQLTRGYIILVKEVKAMRHMKNSTRPHRLLLTCSILRAMSSAHIAYGTIVGDIREVSFL